MSQDVFSLYHSKTRKCLLEKGTAEELVERQRQYMARGGNALLVVARNDEEPQFPRPKNIAKTGEKIEVPITTDEPAETPNETTATQMSMLEVPERVEVVSSKLLLEHGQLMCNFILANSGAVGMNFAWSSVIKRVLNGEVPTTEFNKRNKDRDSMYEFLKKSVRAIVELARDQKGREAIVREGTKALELPE